MSTQPRLRTIPEAMIELGVGRSTLYGLLASGEIEAVNIGRRRLVLTESIDGFIERLRDQPPAAPLPVAA